MPWFSPEPKFKPEPWQTGPEIRFCNVMLPEPLPNKAKVRSKIAEPDWIWVLGPKICLNWSKGPVQGSRISAKNQTKLDHSIISGYQTIVILKLDMGWTFSVASEHLGYM